MKITGPFTIKLDLDDEEFVERLTKIIEAIVRKEIAAQTPQILREASRRSARML